MQTEPKPPIDEQYIIIRIAEIEHDLADEECQGDSRYISELKDELEALTQPARP